MSARQAGRYLLYDSIASGGMASVHLGRAVGTGGFARLVAVKRLHAHIASDPEFVEMFLDEARLASRIHHPNVVATIDVVTHEGQLLLVMEHVLGESWWHLARAARERGEPLPVDVVAAVVSGLLSGLHAAHEARSEAGEPLEIVHRDVSPQNLLVGVDGVPRVVDFGIAKAVSRAQSTRDGALKGKLAYMAPEQIRREAVTRRADVYAAGIVLWESLANRRLFAADDAAAVIAAVLEGGVPAPSSLRADVPAALDGVVLRAVAVDPSERYATALEFARALEAAVTPAGARAVADCVSSLAAVALEQRRRLVAMAEQTPSERSPSASGAPAPEPPPAGAMTAEQRKLLATAETQVTSFGVAIPRARRRARRVIALAALLATAIAGSAFAFAWSKHDRRADVTRAPPEPLAPTESPASAAVPTPEPSEPSDPTASSASSAQSAQSAAPASSASSLATAHRAPRRTRPPRRARDECNPAYTLEANGVKRYKPQCL
jgi:serine/threonine-protein kinase